ncbi:hypothetical protein IFR04_009460 [Cadophora malorum]|uniref:Prenylcysteine lyase domain-containing protein n=1 Tax=Cadophora malorum TaxID=108018 RepID=A0A8H7TDB8_9HELO|nr:hypothetical protein IFR04_009460 [Cadophora malorum]
MNYTYLIIPGVLFLSAQAAISDAAPQQLLNPNNQSSQPMPRSKIAIIGAGLSGATAAYYLHDSIRESQEVDITIFESLPEMGSRIKSIKYRGRTIEVGAPAASTHDWCVLRAMKDVGLAPKAPDPRWYFRVKKRVGVWNGGEILIAEPHEPQCSTWWEIVWKLWRDGTTAWYLRKVSPPMWWELGKLMWRYGVSPWRFHRAVSSDLAAWDRFGADLDAWERLTFSNLGSEMDKSGLSAQVLGSARSCLRDLGHSNEFLNEVVEPCTRARFGQNLDGVRGLSAEIAFREFFSRSVSVSGGNCRLVDRLISLSKADLKFNSGIKEIHPGQSKRYKLRVESPLPKSNVSTYWEDFDAVAIAVPFSMSGVSFGEEVDIRMNLDASSHPSERHITHFVSSQDLSPDFFKLLPRIKLPDMISTTPYSSNVPDIYSITLLDTITRIDRTGCSPPPLSSRLDLDDCDSVIHEGIYRVVSSETIDNQTLSKMVGSSSDYDFPFIHRQVWPYITATEIDFQLPTRKIELAPGLYYTGGGEDIISSLEMSCRMGFNAGMKVFNAVSQSRERD